MTKFLSQPCWASLFLLVLIASGAKANLHVSFEEGAPKDQFRIENIGSCGIFGTSIIIDLLTSRGGLIFDVNSQGNGVEVFQPFELVERDESLADEPIARDGQTDLRLDIFRLNPSEAILLTIGLDDTLGQCAITVSGLEIEGLSVTYSRAQVQKSAKFSALSEAVIPIANC